MKSYTETDAQEWIEKEAAGIALGLAECKATPEYLKESPHFRECWGAGCWLNFKLREQGATEEEVRQIGFAHGQRSFFGGAVKWAAAYLNEFIRNGKIADKPGIEFADELNAKHIKRLVAVIQGNEGDEVNEGKAKL